MIKKRVVFLLIILLLCVGCSKIKGTNVQTQEASEELEDGTEPFNRMRCAFLTYEDLENWFKPDENGHIPAKEDLNQYGNRYDEFIQQMVQGEIRIPKVYFREELIVPKRKESYPPISIWSDYRPWLCYDTLMGNAELLIAISYLSEAEEKYAKDHTIDEFIYYISPKKYGIGNLSYPWIEEVTVEKMVLKDREVGALYIKEISA